MFYSNSGDENSFRSDKAATDWDCAKVTELKKKKN